MSNEVWEEVYGRLAELIEAHKTTLVFVNTRRLAERVTHKLGIANRRRQGHVAPRQPFSQTSPRRRESPETRRTQGARWLPPHWSWALTSAPSNWFARLEPTHSLATFLQRIGRAEHRRGGLPKGRLFPLSRDELVEVAAMLRAVRARSTRYLANPAKALDVLAQQIVASAACEDWQEQKLFELMRVGLSLSRTHTNGIRSMLLRMLAEGFSTKRGRRGALCIMMPSTSASAHGAERDWWH